MGTYKFEVDVNDDELESLFNLLNTTKREAIAQSSFKLAGIVRSLQGQIQEQYDGELDFDYNNDSNPSRAEVRQWLNLAQKLLPDGYNMVVQYDEFGDEMYQRMALTNFKDEVIQYSNRTTDVTDAILDTLQIYLGIGIEKRSDYWKEFEKEIQEERTNKEEQE